MAALLLTFWTILMAGSCTWVAVEIWKRQESRSFQPVPGLVLQSRLTEGFQTKDKNVSIRYRYEAGGRGRESTTIYAFKTGVLQLGEARARQLTNTYPVGADIVVYVNPADPEEAVLVRGWIGQEMRAVLLLLPVVILTASFWRHLHQYRRHRKHSPVAGGGVAIRIEEKFVRIRINPPVPLLMMAFGTGIGSLFALFLSIPWQDDLPRWIILAPVGAGLFFRRLERRELASGKADLLIEKGTRRLTLPWQPGDKRDCVVEPGEITAVILQAPPQKGEAAKKNRSYAVSLLLKNGKRRRLGNFPVQEDAEAFVKWLREEFGIKEVLGTEVMDLLANVFGGDPRAQF